MQKLKDKLAVSEKRSTSQPRGSLTGRIHALNHQLINRVEERDGKENSKVTSNGSVDQHEEEEEEEQRKANEDGNEDMVSGFLYDRLQREVIALRKICESKEGTINSKDEEIKQMLLKKVDALTKAIEVETKKAKREAAAREKENTLAMLTYMCAMICFVQPCTQVMLNIMSSRGRRSFLE